MQAVSEIPKLIDSQTGHFIMNTLRQCHDNRVVAYSYVFNGVVVVVFLTIACIALYLCFYRKKTPLEKRRQLEQDQRIILEKIRSLKEQKQNYFMEGSMTHLPVGEPRFPHTPS